MEDKRGKYSQTVAPPLTSPPGSSSWMISRVRQPRLQDGIVSARTLEDDKKGKKSFDEL